MEKGILTSKIKTARISGFVLNLIETTEKTTEVGTNAVRSNPLYGMHEEYEVATEWSKEACVWTQALSVTTSDIKGFEACTWKPDGGLVASEIGVDPISIIDDASGDVLCAITLHDCSFGESLFGDCASSDDGNTESIAWERAEYETCRIAMVGGASCNGKGANTLNAYSYTFYTSEKDKRDSSPGTWYDADPAVVLPTWSWEDAAGTCKPSDHNGGYQTCTTLKTENSEGASNPDETSDLLDGTTAVRGDTGAEALPEWSLGSQKCPTKVRHQSGKTAAMVMQTSELTTEYFNLIRVETLDAVNVAPDGISVATSLGEIVTGKHLSWVACVTVKTVEQVEEDVRQTDVHGGTCHVADHNDAINVARDVVRIMVRDSCVKVTTITMVIGCSVCCTLKPCLTELTAVVILDEKMPYQSLSLRGAHFASVSMQDMQEVSPCYVADRVKQSLTAEKGDCAATRVGTLAGCNRNMNMTKAEAADENWDSRCVGGTGGIRFMFRTHDPQLCYGVWQA